MHGHTQHTHTLSRSHTALSYLVTTVNHPDTGQGWGVYGDLGGSIFHPPQSLLPCGMWVRVGGENSCPRGRRPIKYSRDWMEEWVWCNRGRAGV